MFFLLLIVADIWPAIVLAPDGPMARPLVATEQTGEIKFIKDLLVKYRYARSLRYSKQYSNNETRKIKGRLFMSRAA